MISYIYEVLEHSAQIGGFMSSEKKEKKDIEVVTGNGDEISISQVKTHLPITKPKIEKIPDKKIVIPKGKKK